MIQMYFAQHKVKQLSVDYDIIMKPVLSWVMQNTFSINNYESSYHKFDLNNILSLYEIMVASINKHCCNQTILNRSLLFV